MHVWLHSVRAFVNAFVRVYMIACTAFVPMCQCARLSVCLRVQSVLLAASPYQIEFATTLNIAVDLCAVCMCARVKMVHVCKCLHYVERKNRHDR